MHAPAEFVSPKSVANRTYVVALLGNPNTGKTTLFNRLTGLNQTVANYPGTTVQVHQGNMKLEGKRIRVLDLPGTYSLGAIAPDERLVIDVLTGQVGQARPDLLVCVLDATNLKRHLFLASQLAEYELPMVLVLNQVDLARKRGIQIDRTRLERELGVPVIATVGTRGEGMDALRQAIVQTLEKPALMRRMEWNQVLRTAIERIQNCVGQAGDSINFAEAQRLLFDQQSAIKSRLKVPAGQLNAAIHHGREEIRASGLNPGAAEAVLHYARVEPVVRDSLVMNGASASPQTDALDGILMHRLWGSLIFLGLMWLVFQSVYAWASPLMEAIEMAVGWAESWAEQTLTATPVWQSLVTDGVIAGVGGVMMFLPQIFILFFFIALLEGSGYMARAAFLMDKLFGWCGLNGKSFVPLLSCYACAIPGIMAAKALEDPRARLTTMLMAPLMSCSARLPVYVLLIGAFVEPIYGPFIAGFVLFVMHFVGLAVALPLAWLLNRFILKTPPLPFILELPAYKVPHPWNVLMKMWEGGREFILRAGTVILAFSVVIWALLYFPRHKSVEAATRAEFIEARQTIDQMDRETVEQLLADPESQWAQAFEARLAGAYLESSFLGHFGKAVQPVFALAGFDWKIPVALLASFPAREMVISSLGIIYNLGPDVDEQNQGLRDRMKAEVWERGPRQGQSVFTLPVVGAILAFFALCLQCGSTVAVMARQLNWSWALGTFMIYTALAWLAAVMVYQIGSFLIS